jgi:hypothetical protein
MGETMLWEDSVDEAGRHFGRVLAPGLERAASGSYRWASPPKPRVFRVSHVHVGT